MNLRSLAYELLQNIETQELGVSIYNLYKIVDLPSYVHLGFFSICFIHSTGISYNLFLQLLPVSSIKKLLLDQAIHFLFLFHLIGFQRNAPNVIIPTFL